MDRSSRRALSDRTNFLALQVGGRRCKWPDVDSTAGALPVSPPDDRHRRALELGLTPGQLSAAVADDSFSVNQSWAGPVRGRSPSPSPPPPPAAPPPSTPPPLSAEMMPWDTPPMRRPKPDQTLLKGDNLFSISFNGPKARSPYRCQQRVSDAAGRSLNDSWAFYKSFSPADVLTAQTLFITPTKSVFTIDSRTSQILMWNDMATDLLGYSGTELSQMRLRELFVAAESRPRMEEAHLSSQGSVVVFAGNVVEIMTKRGETIPVSLWLRKIETSTAERRCVAVLEPVQRKTVLMTCDQCGRVTDVSGGVSDLFSQAQEDCVGLQVSHFIPSLQLPADPATVPKELRVQEVTAKRADGSSFPVSVRLSGMPPSSATPAATISLQVHAYTSLMGLVVLDEDLKIRNYNRNFISLTVGYEKDALIDQDIRRLIPTFDEDMAMADSDDDSLSLPPVDLEESVTAAALDGVALLSLHEPCRQPTQGDETRPAGEPPASPAARCGRPLVASTPGPGRAAPRLPLTDNTYYGLAKHRDGSEFSITYDLCTIGLDDDSIVYCLWIGLDRPEPRDSSDTSVGVSHYSLGQVIQQQATSPPAGCIESEDAEHSRGEYSRYYTTIQQIGKGAFGFVKLGYRNGDRLLVVTKFIRKDKVHSDQWVDDPVLTRRVPLEVSLLAMLQHQHIIRVLDVYENERYLQMVMERHGCMDLFEFIDRDPSMDEPLASHIFRQICSALDHLHALEILHRDVKDENVIIDSSFHVKLIDFGSATFVSHGQLLSTFCGTVEYCAPEVLLGNKYDGYMLEVWSLGVTLFTLLCGENPFHDVEDTISKPLRLPADITPELSELLSGLLDKSPQSRMRLPHATEHAWTVQSVDLAAYKFEEVVACSACEVNPPRFLTTGGREGDLNGAVSFSALTHSTPPKYTRRVRQEPATLRDEHGRNRVHSDETPPSSLPVGDSAPLHQSLHQ